MSTVQIKQLHSWGVEPAGGTITLKFLDVFTKRILLFRVNFVIVLYQIKLFLQMYSIQMEKKSVLLPTEKSFSFF